MSRRDSLILSIVVPTTKRSNTAMPAKLDPKISKARVDHKVADKAATAAAKALAKAQVASEKAQAKLAKAKEKLSKYE